MARRRRNLLLRDVGSDLQSDWFAGIPASDLQSDWFAGIPASRRRKAWPREARYIHGPSRSRNCIFDRACAIACE